MPPYLYGIFNARDWMTEDPSRAGTTDVTIRNDAGKVLLFLA
jgi:hypothetical protein